MEPIRNYNLIAEAIKVEYARLTPKDEFALYKKIKADSILGAMHRLYLVIEFQRSEHLAPLTNRNWRGINPEEAKKVDLSTINAMLDVRISVWIPEHDTGGDFGPLAAGYVEQRSVREALNISNNNIFTLLGGGCGPFWGKAQALQNVERALGL